MLNLYTSENGGKFPPLDKSTNNFMFESDLLYPEYLADAAILACPCDPDYNPDKNFRLTSDHPDGTPAGQVHPDCITNMSYSYLGWMVMTDKEAEAFFNAYDTMSPADYDKDLIVPEGSGNAEGSVLHRFSEGVDRFLITDDDTISSGDETYHAVDETGLSTVPIMWDQISTDISEFSHIPAGQNVLYLDGHVDFHRYDLHSTQFPVSPMSAAQFGGRPRAPIPDCDCAPETLSLRSTVGHAADAIGDNEWLELAVLMAALVGTGFLFGLVVSRTSKAFRALLYVFLFIFIVLFGILMLPFFLTALITDKLVRQHHKRASAGAHPEPETV